MDYWYNNLIEYLEKSRFLKIVSKYDSQPFEKLQPC